LHHYGGAFLVLIIMKKDETFSSFKKRASPTQSSDIRITEIVHKKIEEALTKKKLCHHLGISFPTLQERLWRCNWTAREKLILKKLEIIPKNLYDVDLDTDQRLASGEGTFLPSPGLYIPTGKSKKGKGGDGRKNAR